MGGPVAPPAGRDPGPSESACTEGPYQNRLLNTGPSQTTEGPDSSLSPHRVHGTPVRFPRLGPVNTPTDIRWRDVLH